MAGIQFSGLASGLDTQSIIADLMKAERIRVDKVDKQKQLVEMKKEVWEEMNIKLYTFYKESVFELKSQGTFKARTASVSDSAVISAKATSDTSRGVSTVKVNQLAMSGYLYSNEVSIDGTTKTTKDFSFTLNDGQNSETIELEEGATIHDFIQAINDSGLDIDASYDKTNNRIFMTSSRSGEDSEIKFSGLDIPEEIDFFEDMGFYVNSSGEVNESEAIFYKHTNGTIINSEEYNALDPIDQAGFTQQVLGKVGQNALYEYNGIEFEATSNEVKVNNLSITLKAVSTTSVTINVTQNTDAIYDSVKNFITKYNELIKEINTKINAKSAGDYEPLTDEEKESLDEKTIEKWETKIKDSLLRRDDVLTSIGRNMRDILTSSSGVDTSSFPSGFKFLSDLGIVTGDYSEQGKLHIEGDDSDPEFSIKENKLRKAIEENPDQVADLITALGDEIYSMMNEKMKSTELSSALTFYNDKAMDKEIYDFETKIYDLEDRLVTVEERYYRQFTAMEQIIQRANSQSGYLASMLGGGASA